MYKTSSHSSVDQIKQITVAITLKSREPTIRSNVRKTQSVFRTVDLRIYPTKSCRGISIQISFLTKRNLDLDRRWVSVDAETSKYDLSALLQSKREVADDRTCRFITIREISELTLIDIVFASLSETTSSKQSPNGAGDAENLVISIRHTDKRVRVPARPTDEWLKENTDLLDVNIREYDTDAYDYRNTINDIFTDFSKKPVKLVYKGPTPRILRGNGAPDILGREQRTNFLDVLPLLIENEASIEELNGRLRSKGYGETTVELFQANNIFRGATIFLSLEDDRAPKGLKWIFVADCANYQPKRRTKDGNRGVARRR